ERALPRVKDIQVEPYFRCTVEVDQRTVDEGKAHPVTCGGDDRIELLVAAVGEVHGPALEPRHVGWRLHASVPDEIEKFRVERRVLLQGLVIRCREPVTAVSALDQQQRVFRQRLAERTRPGTYLAAHHIDGAAEQEFREEVV